MKKQELLKFVNPVLALDFLALALNGILRPMIPRNIFFQVHPRLGFALILLVLLHVILNWSWIRQQFRKQKA